jgi:hypothetical protein
MTIELEKDMENSKSGLSQDTIFAFAWRVWGQAQETCVDIQSQNPNLKWDLSNM